MDLEQLLQLEMAEVRRAQERLEAAKTLLSLQGAVVHGKDNEPLYIIESVLERRKRNGRYYYKIKWLGFVETTWEPVSNLPVAVVETYDATFPRPTPRRKSKSVGW